MNDDFDEFSIFNVIVKIKTRIHRFFPTEEKVQNFSKGVQL